GHPLLPGQRLQGVRAAVGLHAEPGQPDDHTGGKRAPDGSDGPASQRAAAEDEVEKATLRASLWDHQAMVWLHALSAERAGESAGGVEPDHPGLQSETGAEPSQVCKTDGGGELKRRAAVFSCLAVVGTTVEHPNTNQPRTPGT